MEITDDNVREYNEKELPPVRDREPFYSVVPRLRKYNVNPGDRIEIDVYLTGLGIPDASKLNILYSSPNVIDVSSQATLTTCVRFAPAKLDGKDMVVPVAGAKYADKQDIDPNGITIRSLQGFFLPVPTFPVPNEEQLLMPDVMAEKQVEGYDPISISLKTLGKAAPGDYEIYFTLTYIHQNVTKQASDKVKFHLNSWWDRYQAKVVTAASIIAFISFILIVLTFINTC